ncbi:cytochrome b/b6 domain-containing protein [Mesorhizobium sp. WSM4935]|uniref:cytochrome b/b6 domain-containing protein n=1 Tax=Mesorhizobium sp. WSM4935 TaxID=3038547 RepID=UPI002414E219|nr:cytochrome b/b6 domain-containing protein [Mesorhizobium sp. WSM4935]MDG4875335.1 cytochrome b/b6 domain-containing protein [Mesorhizobium sp. WSM4935]
MHDRAAEIFVWDPFVRIAHWTITVGFFVAYLTEDATAVHVWAGYVVGGLVAARVVWGFVGPRHARFSDFVTGPTAAISYFWDLIRGRSKRYVGHSPAGGAMVLALLAFLAATVATGLVRYAEEEGAGPLASLYAQTSSIAVSQASEQEENEAGEGRARSAVGEAHDVLANVTFALVVFHILGVLLASFVHHENLAKAMVTGRKRHG